MSYERDAAVQAGQAQFGPAQVADMKAMLTNPNVSAEEKSVLLYGLSTMGALPDEEIKKRAERIDGVDAEDCVEGGESPQKNIAHLRETYSTILARESQQAVEGARNALRQGGYSNSNQIIDQGVKGLRLFDEFYPYYERAGGQGSGGSGSGPGANVPVIPSSGGQRASPGASYTHSGVDPGSLRAGMDEFRGIDFTAFRTDAQTLKEVYATVDQSADQLDKAWNSNTADWTGEAFSVAQGRFADLTDGSGDLLQALKSAPENITTTVDEYIVKDVTRFSDAILDLYGDGRINELTPSQVGLLIGAEENLPAVLRHLAEIQREQSSESLLWNIGELGVDFVKYTPITGVDAGKLLGIELCEVTEENVAEELRKTRQLHTECGRRLSQFRAAYEARANTVHMHAREYVGAVQECYSSLIQSLGKPLDPLPFAMSADEGQRPQGAAPAVPAGGGDVGGPGSPGGGSSGGPGPSSGGAAPSMPVPGMAGPGMSAPGMSAAQAPEVVSEPGTNPVTGKPLEADPETGEPYPIDPATGETITDLGQERETLTARHGDTRITMSEPDAGGEMAISVSGDSGEQRYTPDEDGKIRVEQDGLEIVAEQPSGQGGRTVVTVDDGAGEPITYALGEQHEGETGSAATTQADASGADGPDPRDERDESQSTSAQGVFGDVFDGADGGGVDLGGVDLGGADSGGADSGIADSGVAAGIAAGMSADDSSAVSREAHPDGPAQPGGSAGLGTAPGGGSPAQADQSGAPSSTSGSAMVSGAGLGDTASAGDEEPGPSGFRIGGDLFGGSDHSGAGGRISGSLNDEDDYGAYDHAGAGR